MIGDVMLILKNQLNAHLRAAATGIADDAGEDKVVFIDTEQKAESALFKSGALSVLLYRIEQETAGRPGDPYVRVSANGLSRNIKPDISLNLYVLFVARFKAYAQGLNYLSEVIRFFQSNKVFNRQNTPDLSEEILELAVDLVSLSSQQQNELWGLLRTGYLPSVAYKVRTLTFRDEPVDPPGGVVTDISLRGLS